jgi:hypothetical protein
MSKEVFPREKAVLPTTIENSTFVRGSAASSKQANPTQIEQDPCMEPQLAESLKVSSIRFQMS